MRSSLQHLASHSFIHDDSHRLSRATSRTGTIFGRLKRVPKMVFIVNILIGVQVIVYQMGGVLLSGPHLSLFAPSFLG